MLVDGLMPYTLSTEITEEEDERHTNDRNSYLKTVEAARVARAEKVVQEQADARPTSAGTSDKADAPDDQTAENAWEIGSNASGMTASYCSAKVDQDNQWSGTANNSETPATLNDQWGNASNINEPPTNLETSWGDPRMMLMLPRPWTMLGVLAAPKPGVVFLTTLPPKRPQIKSPGSLLLVVKSQPGKRTLARKTPDQLAEIERKPNTIIRRDGKVAFIAVQNTTTNGLAHTVSARAKVFTNDNGLKPLVIVRMYSENTEINATVAFLDPDYDESDADIPYFLTKDDDEHMSDLNRNLLHTFLKSDRGSNFSGIKDPRFTLIKMSMAYHIMMLARVPGFDYTAAI